MKQIINHSLVLKYGVPAIFTLLGAVGGYLYYRFVGCAGGNCAIASNPYISTVYGAVIWFLLGTIVMPGKRERKQEQDS